MSTMTVIAENARIELPARAIDPMSLDEFREWAGNEDLPEKCVVYYVRGDWGVDVSREQIFTHADVKSEFAAVLRSHVNRLDSGAYYSNGVLLSNAKAKVSCNPDGLYVSYDAFRENRVVALEGKKSGYVEPMGSPDMVLEVVSESSLKKDTMLLYQGYWDAGVTEYWLVDAREDEPSFQILTRGTSGFVDDKPAAGWHKSAVFGASFKFVKSQDPLGNPRFRLEIKA